MLESLNLDGKTIIITGGGTGLGKAMAIQVAKSGADVVLASRRLGPLLDTAKEITKLGRKALPIPTDISISSDVEAMVSRSLSEFGKIDVLVNNAGKVTDNVKVPIWDITDEDWKTALDVNLTGAFYCARAVAVHMAQRKCGKIINISSGYGLRGARDMYTYTCPKGGMIQLTKTLAISLAKYGITANTLAPGFVPTDGTAVMKAGLPKSLKAIPTGKTGTPEEIGLMVAFLCSDASNYINGETIVVDGGSLAGGFAPTGYTPVIPI